MNFAKFFEALEAGLKAANSLAEAGENLGLPSQISDALNIASVLLKAAENVKQLIEDRKIVATGGDLARIDAIMHDLEQRNNALAAKIAAS